MERAEWLKKMRAQAAALYDHLAPLYWVKWGLHPDPVHGQFIEKFLGQLGPHSTILDAGCGAGRYDGLLLDAGHTVLGIDQSGGMLARAREHFPLERFPALRYAQIGLQEMQFENEFDGAICMDALEHVSPEDWPGILVRFQKALKPGGVFYFTTDLADWERVNRVFERAKAMGLPVVFGEVVDEVDTAYSEVMALDWQAIPGARADPAVYHYYTSPEQMRSWLDQAGLTIAEEGTGDGYGHHLVRKNG